MNTDRFDFPQAVVMDSGFRRNDGEIQNSPLSDGLFG
jgi:hypothetical protein